MAPDSKRVLRLPHSLRGGEFLIGQEPALTKPLRPLEGRADQMIEGPHTLKVRFAPRRHRLCPAGFANGGLLPTAVWAEQNTRPMPMLIST